MRRLFLILCAAALWAPAAWADTAHDSRAERLATGAKVLAARDNYVRHCAACHGADGTGESATIDFTSPEAVASLTREDMIEGARVAHPADTVKTWTQELGEAGLLHVVDYIREALMLPAPVADASVGRKIYARTCSVCHGERGNAASWAQNSLSPPPFDFTSAKARELTRQRMIHSVTFGTDDSAMMPFATQFTRDEIAAVVDYIRATFVRAEPEAAVRPIPQVAGAPSGATGAHDHGGHVKDLDAPFPIGMVGDVAAGKVFYESNCVQCHGLKGDGNGPRAYFMRRRPKDFTSARAREEYDRPHLFEGVAKGVRGTEMPAWSKVLTLQQIADVAEYVFQAFTNAEAAAPGMMRREDTTDHAPADHGSRGPADHGGHAPAKKN